jgi:hypothetical protein
MVLTEANGSVKLIGWIHFQTEHRAYLGVGFPHHLAQYMNQLVCCGFVDTAKPTHASQGRQKSQILLALAPRNGGEGE